MLNVGCSTRLARPAALVALALAAFLPTAHAGRPVPVAFHDDPSLGLSDEVVPYEKFARGQRDREPTLTERLEDAVFPENRERQRQIEARHREGSAVEVPERRGFFGDRFLSPGPLGPGFKLPTGATWKPAFVTFGTVRSAVQTFHQGSADITEWANRFDLYGNLTLSGTERILIGFRPLDRAGNFSGYTLGGGSTKSGWNNALNFEPTTLFFEGDFGEIFPRLDPGDKHRLDYGFSIGRQPLVLQDGIMIDDTVDAIGVSRHNLFRLGASSARFTAMAGLHDVHRGDGMRDDRARLYALSASLDYDKSTIGIDAAFVDGGARTGGDGAYLGVSQVRRYGHWNSTLRANASWALQKKTDAVNTGWLLSHEWSRTMPHSSDILYLNSYLALDHYTSAARDPATGGPLGRLGLLNRAVGLGKYDAPLGSDTDKAVGASLGYQHFFDPLAYRQLLLEAGVRAPYSSSDEKTTVAAGAQYQWGTQQRVIWVLGGFGSVDEDGDTGFGARTEALWKF